MKIQVGGHGPPQKKFRYKIVKIDQEIHKFLQQLGASTPDPHRLRRLEAMPSDPRRLWPKPRVGFSKLFLLCLGGG